MKKKHVDSDVGEDFISVSVREDCDLVLGVCPAWPPHHWLHFNLYSVLTSGDGQMINSRIIVLDTY